MASRLQGKKLVQRKKMRECARCGQCCWFAVNLACGGIIWAKCMYLIYAPTGQAVCMCWGTKHQPDTCKSFQCEYTQGNAAKPGNVHKKVEAK